VLKEGQLSLSNQWCWVDTWVFERCLGQAEKEKKEGNQDEAVRQYEKALVLYRGPFLHSDDAPWTLSTRERLRARFLRVVAYLGQAYEDAGRREDAISCYGKGLAADELAEDLYRRLMVCHMRQGRAAEALSVYRRCRRTLLSVLGVGPSPETQALATSLGPSPE
jgi:DNA-binding SARP family transcriptional activator